MSEKVLVLGGTRYFGKRLVHLLLASGAKVTVATRGLAKDDFGNDVERLIIDRENAESMRQSFGSRTWDLAFDQICYSSSDALAACEALKSKVGRVIHASTISVYELDGVQKESAFNPTVHDVRIAPRNAFEYAESKRQAEAVYFQRASFPVIAARIPLVVGPDDYSKRLEFHIERVVKEIPVVIKNMQAEISIISSKSAAEFLFWVGRQNLSGPINLCDEGSVSPMNMMSLIEKFSGKKPVIEAIGSPENVSPYFNPLSRIMSNDRAKSLGYKFPHVESWWPAHVEATIAAINRLKSSG